MYTIEVKFLSLEEPEYFDNIESIEVSMQDGSIFILAKGEMVLGGQTLRLHEVESFTFPFVYPNHI